MKKRKKGTGLSVRLKGWFFLIYLFIFACLFVIGNAMVPVFAKEEQPDLEKEGSIMITMRETETQKLVSGGSFSLYRVAEIEKRDGNYLFQYMDAFSGCGFSLEDVTSEKLAGDLASYVEKHSVKAAASGTGKNGTVTFSSLSPGLYLVTQPSAAKGFLPASPFLVSLPLRQADGSLNYQVDASPKMELKETTSTSTESQNGTTQKPQTPQTPQKPKTTEEPGSKNDLSSSPGKKLPQTGQLNWPVPVMTIAGLLLFSVGWILENRKGKLL